MNLPSLPSKKTFILIGIIVLVALAAIVFFKVDTPITPQLTALWNAILTLNLDKITTAFWALIGAFGSAIGVATAAIYAWYKKGQAFVAEKMAHLQTKDKIQSLYGQNEQANSILQEKDNLLKTKEDFAKKIAAEKEQITNQYGEIKGSFEQQKTQVESLRLQNQELMNQLKNPQIKVVEVHK
jgi:hypothetical protein